MGLRTIMMNRKNVLYCLLVFLSLAFYAGCSEQTLDPAQIGRFRPVPVVNVILDSLGVEDEPTPTYAGAQDPTPEDVMSYEQDYAFGVGDVIRITIYELIQQGAIYVNDFVVTETGRISVPEVGQIRAAGLSEAKLEDEIRDILSPNILLDPIVTVRLGTSESRMASISGQGVGRSLRLAIPRYDFRLTDLISVAGGIEEFNVSYIYVSREVTGNENISTANDDFAMNPKSKSISKNLSLIRQKMLLSHKSKDNDRVLEIVEPYAKGTIKNQVTITSSEMASTDEIVTQNSNGNGRVEWVFEGGKWIPVKVGHDPVRKSPLIEAESGFSKDILPDEPGYGWDQLGTAGKQTRVIKIPVDKLLGGDPKYNIIIRPGDSVTVPVDIIGEFYVSGNVNRSGPINLTGRPMTLKMAISAAGGLGQLAWPKKVEVVRRIGKNKEEIVMVDLDKIAKGLQPDFFVKPHDLINVGTHSSSRFLAVLRNAFRVTYGFGFIYDRNFATKDIGQFDDFGKATDNLIDTF
jgi:polysaccharide biosynthesis/export protein